MHFFIIYTFFFNFLEIKSENIWKILWKKVQRDFIRFESFEKKHFFLSIIWIQIYKTKRSFQKIHFSIIKHFLSWILKFSLTHSNFGDSFKFSNLFSLWSSFKSLKLQQKFNLIFARFSSQSSSCIACFSCSLYLLPAFRLNLKLSLARIWQVFASVCFLLHVSNKINICFKSKSLLQLKLENGRRFSIIG